MIPRGTVTLPMILPADVGDSCEIKITCHGCDRTIDVEIERDSTGEEWKPTIASCECGESFEVAP